MGDRANIVIEKDNEAFPHEVYLYTHWSGSELPDILRAALVRGRNRWTDGQYLARIIFSEMINGSVMDETGYGISTRPGDGQSNMIYVNVEKQTVRHKKQQWSFEDFVSQVPA